MTVELLERAREDSQSYYEVSVGSVDDLRLFFDGLTGIIAEQRIAQRSSLDSTDEHKLELAVPLREKVAEDLNAVEKGAAPEDFHYTVNDKDLVLEAIKVAAQKEQAATIKTLSPDTVMQKPAQSSASNSGKRSYPLPRQRITSFNDPRLDEKPRRWFRR